MATFTSKLKPNSWINADELGRWLNDDKPERYEVPTAGEQATVNIQSIKYTARNQGIAGNAITIEYVSGGSAGSESVAVSESAITVTIEDAVSTAQNIRQAVSNSGAASALVFAELIVQEPDVLADVQARTQQIVSATSLAGGVNDTPFDDSSIPFRRQRYEMLINSACQRIEGILRTNVLAKTYQEDIDGNDSNVVVPAQWPIISVADIRIDYNRNFDEASIVDQINILFRGMPDTRQDVSANDIRLVGNDIYLRDDDSDNVIGRVFSGSVAGSVRVTYKAGWANNTEDVPEDLRLAALFLAEWLEFRRSNRDVGVSSKGVRGESYSKGEELIEGIPASIYGMLENYINHSFGEHFRHQNNIFGV